MHVFLDESGYTGQDLLNPEQPVFTIATLGIPEGECLRLRDEYFGAVQARELKYSSLSRRPRQQRMILSFLRDVLARPGCVKASTLHKRFVLVTKMIDLLTENAMAEDGYNLYEDGANIGLSNLLYYGIPVICGESYFDSLLGAFSDAVRHRSWESFTHFRRVLFARDLTEEQNRWLSWFQEPVRRWGYPFFEALDGDDLELALTSAGYLMGRWRFEHREEPIVLVHDRSSNMAGLEPLWRFFTDKGRMPFERDWGDRSVIYPIGVERTDFEDSKDWSGLQLADVVAGAYADAGRTLAKGGGFEDDYTSELWHDVLADAPAEQSLWPAPKFTPEEMGTAGSDPNEALEYITDEMRRVGFDPRRGRGPADE